MRRAWKFEKSCMYIQIFQAFARFVTLIVKEPDVFVKNAFRDVKTYKGKFH